MSDTDKLASRLQALQGIELPKLDMSELASRVSYFNSSMNEAQEDLMRINQEKYEREVENNENLKSLVDYNLEISNYNRKLVSLNEKILNKINSLDDTLLFLNDAFINKAEMDEEQIKANNALLLELITIIDSNDAGKLKQFTSGLAAPVISGLVVEYFKMKLGLS